MKDLKVGKVAYILKMYPRFSETFIVNELLAHENSGISIDIYSLRSPIDGRFHESLSKVKAGVIYIPPKFDAKKFWKVLHATQAFYPNVMQVVARYGHFCARDVYQSLLISQHVSRSRITQLHAHFANAAANVALLVSEITSIPYTVTTHAKDIFHESVDDKELKNIIQKSKQTIAISQYNYNYLTEKLNNLGDKLTFIYNGLNLSQFSYQSPNMQSHNILAVGRLVEKKGFSVLIKACAILAKRNISFHCSIVGSGDYFEQLQELIDTESMQKFVTLLGPQPQWKVIELMRDSRIFAAPCVVAKDGNRDGLPTVLLEAMALGVPCVATDVTAIPELINDGVSGFVVPQFDAVSLFQRLEQLLGDDDLCASISLQARSMIESNFDIQSNSKRIRQLWFGCGEESKNAKLVTEVTTQHKLPIEAS